MDRTSGNFLYGTLNHTRSYTLLTTKVFCSVYRDGTSLALFQPFFFIPHGNSVISDCAYLALLKQILWVVSAKSGSRWTKLEQFNIVLVLFRY